MYLLWKGIFGSVLKGSKTKHVPEVETEDTKESMDELSTIFSTVNFSCVSENEEDQDELNIGKLPTSTFALNLSLYFVQK